MKARKITQAEWLQEVTKNIKNSIHTLSYGPITEPIVIVHKKTQVDEELCKRLGYEIIESYCNGGTIVTNPGDLVIGHYYVLDNEWHKRFSTYFCNWLCEKGLKASLENNDITVDGYKVCGICITRYGNLDFTGVAIGINTNLDHIKAICKKPMVKVPKGLSDYGITTEEVEQMFLDFCEQDE
jgi:lipoate-protein ligase A